MDQGQLLCVKSIGIIVSDGLAGLDSTIAQSFPNTPHQKCCVHLQRNLSAMVRREDKKELAQDVRDVLSPDNENHTKEKALVLVNELVGKWQKKYRRLSKYILKMEREPYFTYLDYHVIN